LLAALSQAKNGAISFVNQVFGRVELHRGWGVGLHVYVSEFTSKEIGWFTHGRIGSRAVLTDLSFNRLRRVPLGACKLSWGSRTRTTAIWVLKVMCCKLKKIYVFYENFIHCGFSFVLPFLHRVRPGLAWFGLVSHVRPRVQPGLTLFSPVSRRVGLGST